ncbi:hypothetical protein THIOSC13_1200008 [uncultured Thiomicrorhabdus sp.]
MFALERDQQAVDESMRHVTTFRILKDRFTGQSTGETLLLGYNKETGVIFENAESFEDAYKSTTTNEEDGF